VAQPILLKPASVWVGLADLVRYPPPWALALLGLGGVALVALGMLLRKPRPATEEMRRTLLASVATDSIGSLFSERFGRYQLVDKLGEGGMATVYRALPFDTLDEREAVAIKVIASKLAEADEYTLRFQREIDICRSLDHPNIVRLIDWGQRDERIYLVLEFVRGKTLAAKLAAQPLLRPEEVKTILEGLTAGMVYAHNRGVVHRDLKPENLMLTEGGMVKVMDFGLARGEGSGKLTRTGTAMGTPAYMAPEQIQDQPFDARTDQYALGMIAYQLLAGRLAFESNDIMQLLFAQVSQKPKPPSHHNPQLPDEVDAVVLRMLEKRREDRFPTTEEAAQWLFQTLEGYR
jgi:serine/threonine-protein kinase